METKKKRGGIADWLSDLSDGMTSLIEGIGDAFSGGEAGGDAGGCDSGGDAGGCDGGGGGDGGGD